MNFVYANLGSGPNAGGIGWCDFGPGFTLLEGVPITGLTANLANGVTVTFDLTLVHVSGSNRSLSAVPAPIPGAYFGSARYTGLTGFPVLYTSTASTNTEDNLHISNIVVTDAQGNSLSNYTVLIANGENTSTGGTLKLITNGADWQLLNTIGANNPPSYVQDENIVTISSTTPPSNSAYLFSTLEPSAVIATIEPTGLSSQGFAIGFAATQVELYKVINGRRYPTDQFDLEITGSNSSIANTSNFKFTKSVDKTIAYIDDIITYTFVFTNNGNVPADNVVFSAPVPNETTLVPSSLTVSVPYISTLPTIQLMNPVAPDASVTIIFKVKVIAIPTLNPIINAGTLYYTYTVDPAEPSGVTATSISNSVLTVVFRYNFSQSVTDLLQSVILEEASYL